MMRGRTISRSLFLMGALVCFLAIAAPGAYGDGIVDGTGEAVPVETSTVTEVTEAAPEVSEASPVEDATAVADEAAASADASVDTSSVAEPVESTTIETTTVETGTISTSASAATTSEVPVSDDPSGGDASAVPASSGTDAPSGTTPASTGSATSGSGYSKSSMTIASSSVTSMPPAQRAAMRGPSGPFVSGVGRSPQDVLDDLLGIGNTLGVDDVRGVQITSARGEAGDAPASSGASVPAPLALTGIAIGAFVAVGSALLFAGNGARAAGSTSAA